MNDGSADGASETNGRPLAFGALLALGVNGIVGVGIFFVPSELATYARGLGSVALLAVTALVLTPIVLVYASLARRFDDDGGPVLYARAAFGDIAGFFVGWLAYLSAIASTSAVIFNLALRGIWPALAPRLGAPADSTWGPRMLAISLTLGLSWLCSRGLKLSAQAWSTLTILKLIPLLLLVTIGAAYTPAEPMVVAAAPTSWPKAILVAVFVFQGFEIVPVVAGSARRASSLVPLAMLASVSLSALLYMALQLVAVRAVPDLAHSSAPLVDVAAVVGGSSLATLVRVGTNVSALGIAVGMVTMTPWYLSTAARRTLRGGLADVDSQGVPRRALMVTTALVLVLVCLGSRANLLALSSLSVVIQYLSAALALLVLGRGPIRGIAVVAAMISLGVASGATGEIKVAFAGVILGVVLWALLRSPLPLSRKVEREGLREKSPG